MKCFVPLLQSGKDIVRVMEWKDSECYSGCNYKKFYKAPGHHCFSLVVGAHTHTHTHTHTTIVQAI